MPTGAPSCRRSDCEHPSGLTQGVLRSKARIDTDLDPEQNPRAVAARSAFVVTSVGLLWPAPFGARSSTAQALVLLGVAVVASAVLLRLWSVNRRLRAKLEEFQQVEAVKTQFLNTVAHELSTPMTPIRIQLNLLEGPVRAQLDAESQKGFAILNRNLERLRVLVEKVLTVARLQAGRLRVRKEKVLLDRLAAEAVESFGEMAGRAGVALEKRLAPDLAIVSDPHQISQVLYNLISNALKFTPPGGRVFVTAAAEGPEVVLRVEDTGRGLTTEEVRKLFEPFSQVHEPAATSQAGTGLGLYICRGIVQELGGRIWCESPGRDQGATFAFALRGGGVVGKA